MALAIDPALARDRAATIYRLDMRDYRWSARRWEQLVAAYPYAPALDGTMARTLAENTGTALPWLRRLVCRHRITASVLS